jgi:hypothetical protein
MRARSSRFEEQRMSRRLSSGPGVVLALSVALLSGCGQRQQQAPRPGNGLYGKVLHHGQPLTFGVVQFFDEGRLLGQAPIGQDGSYSMPGLSVGTIQICVLPLVPSFPPVPGPGLPPGAPGLPPGMPPGPPPPPLPPPGVIQPEQPARDVPEKKGAGEDRADPKDRGPNQPPPLPPGVPEPPRLPELSEETRAILAQLQEKYGNPNNPRLTCTVQPGWQPHDIVLE